jgi:hypothetical protein
LKFFLALYRDDKKILYDMQAGASDRPTAYLTLSPIVCLSLLLFFKRVSGEDLGAKKIINYGSK